MLLVAFLSRVAFEQPYLIPEWRPREPTSPPLGLQAISRHNETFDFAVKLSESLVIS
jgi:hypothetical protein